ASARARSSPPCSRPRRSPTRRTRENPDAKRTPAGEAVRVRFELEIQSLSGGTARGTVTREGSVPQRFSGWLELLRILEDRSPRLARGAEDEPVASSTSRGGRPAPGEGASR